MSPLEELAVVESVAGTRMTLSMPRMEACRECGLCAAGSDDATMRLETENLIGARPGDRVRVTMRTTRLRIAAMLFGLPTVLFLAGLFAGAATAGPAAGLLAGAALLVLYLPFLARYARGREPVVSRAGARDE